MGFAVPVGHVPGSRSPAWLTSGDPAMWSVVGGAGLHFPAARKTDPWSPAPW